MNNMQVMETLSKVLDKLYNALDEIDDIVDNEIPKQRAEAFLAQAALEIDYVIDELDNQAVIDGTKSGAI